MSEYDDKKIAMLDDIVRRINELRDFGVHNDENMTIRTPGRYRPQGDAKTQVQTDILKDEFRANDPNDVAEETGVPRDVEEEIESSTSYGVVSASDPVELRRKTLESGLARSPGNDPRLDPNIQQSLESRQETDYERKKRLLREAQERRK